MGWQWGGGGGGGWEGWCGETGQIAEFSYNELLNAAKAHSIDWSAAATNHIRSDTIKSRLLQISMAIHANSNGSASHHHITNSSIGYVTVYWEDMVDYVWNLHGVWNTRAKGERSRLHAGFSVNGERGRSACRVLNRWKPSLPRSLWRRMLRFQIATFEKEEEREERV